jgi:FkbM family methyltransferase
MAAVITDAQRVIKHVWSHPANDGKRWQALLRAARFQIRGRVFGRRTLARLGDESAVWAYLHRTGTSRVVYGNPPDYPEMLLWRSVLRPGDLFVDVGANVGSYAIWAAECGARVIALEPAEDTFCLLRENISLNGYSVQAIQAAAGEACGVARFTKGRDCVNQFDSEGSTQTRVVTIDSVIGDCTVVGMKVDVEGFEFNVLVGCKRALAERRIRLIQIEWNSASWAAAETDRLPLAELLKEYGYGLYRPDRYGVLRSIGDLGYGADVFARADG